MMRTQKEIAYCDTVLTQSDNELRMMLERMELPAAMQKALVDGQQAWRERSRVIAAKLVELMGGQGV